MCRSDSLAALIEFHSRVGKSMNGYSKSLLLASQCSNAVMQDIQQFLSSDSDEVPQSLKQLAKLAKNKVLPKPSLCFVPESMANTQG